MKKKTLLSSIGRDKQYTGNAINPAIVRASTLTFDSVEQMHELSKKKTEDVEFYGRRGTSTTFAFRKAINELENAEDSYVFSCGTAAITSSLLSFLSSGDHLLMLDNVYEPTREFCDGTLVRMGIEVSYYDPMIGAGIESLIQRNTKVIYLESPGSLTMEVQDIPSITEVAKKNNIITLMDNTYSTSINFKPLNYGVDVSIQSVTKYISGHSDVMLGVASANKNAWPKLQYGAFQLGQCASVDDIYTSLRGIRTLGLRLTEHNKSALIVSEWLSNRPEVDHIRHPALASCPGYVNFNRDFSSGNGLFSFVLKPHSQSSLNAMIDGMRHFKIGFSWGGYESLILGISNVEQQRSVTHWSYEGSLVRLHIGLEDPEDLIDDLKDGFDRFAST